MSTKSEKLQEVLAGLRQETGDIEASAVVSIEGLMMASDMPRDMNRDTIAAMSAALLSLGKRAATEQGRGRFHHLFINGSEGSSVVMMAGDKSLLTVLVRPESNLGLILMEMKRAVDEIAAFV